MKEYQKRLRIGSVIRPECLRLGCTEQSIRKIIRLAFVYGKFLDDKTLVFCDLIGKPDYSLADGVYFTPVEFVRLLFQHPTYRQYFTKEKSSRVVIQRKSVLTKKDHAEFGRLEKELEQFEHETKPGTDCQKRQ